MSSTPPIHIKLKLPQPATTQTELTAMKKHLKAVVVDSSASGHPCHKRTSGCTYSTPGFGSCQRLLSVRSLAWKLYCLKWKNALTRTDLK